MSNPSTQFRVPFFSACLEGAVKMYFIPVHFFNIVFCFTINIGLSVWDISGSTRDANKKKTSVCHIFPCWVRYISKNKTMLTFGFWWETTSGLLGDSPGVTHPPNPTLSICRPWSDIPLDLTSYLAPVIITTASRSQPSNKCEYWS